VPDKPKGRGRELLPSAVKIKAEELKIPLLQPEKLKDTEFIAALSRLKPDIMVVIAFRILPPDVYSLARLGAFNIHASLLPKYRGAAPINWAIINGEKSSGLTSFLLREKVDTGDILLQDTIPIPEGSTAGDLHDIMMPKAAKLACDTCRLLLSGDYKTMSQDNSKASPAPKIFPEQCMINWAQHARDLGNFINGVSPIPGAWTIWEGKRLKILRVEFNSCGRGAPGEYFFEEDHLMAYCQKGLLSILELQVEGKRDMRTADFIKGYRGPRAGVFSVE
jgi:methionyl-tRNA formyltransferase